MSAGANYYYQITAFNAGGANSSNQACATVPLPNQPPWTQIMYPAQDELVYKLTRVMIKWIDYDDQYLTICVLLDNTETMRAEVSSSSAVSSRWLDMDFTNASDGNHIISLEAYDPHGAKASSEVQVRVNQAEVEDKAMQFLYLQSSTTCDPAIPETYKCLTRWLNLPLMVEVSPLFTPEQFQMIKDATTFLTKYTDITFEVRLSSIETLGPDAYCYDPLLDTQLPNDVIFIYPVDYPPDGSLARTCACRLPTDTSPNWVTIDKAIVQLQNNTLTLDQSYLLNYLLMR